ncbi:MAG TPA: hypothetical protein VMW41_03695 [Candidatus Bathyarchaeia archaeon]|nr:hypothetical protein [Candidatus Bathyarchaeia archaeon]
MREKNNSSRLRPYFVPFLALVFILFSFFTLISPRISRIVSFSRVIKENQVKLAKLSEKLALLNSLNEPELADRIALIFDALPQEKQPVYVMSLLKQIAHESGVEIVDLSVKPGEIATMSTDKQKQKNQTPSLTYPIKISGSYMQIEQFAKKMETSLPLMRVEEMSFGRTGQSDLWGASSKIAAFYLFLPVTIGKIDASVQVISEEEAKVYDLLRQFTPAYSSADMLQPSVESGRSNPFI